MKTMLTKKNIMLTKNQDAIVNKEDVTLNCLRGGGTTFAIALSAMKKIQMPDTRIVVFVQGNLQKCYAFIDKVKEVVKIFPEYCKGVIDVSEERKTCVGNYAYCTYSFDNGSSIDVKPFDCLYSRHAMFEGIYNYAFVDGIKNVDKMDCPDICDILSSMASHYCIVKSFENKN